MIDFAIYLNQNCTLMSLHPQKAREILFLMLFAKTHATLDKEATENLIMEQLKVSRSNIQEGWKKLEEMQPFLPKIDEKIEQIATSYDFDRIQAIEKTALRLAGYELLYEKELPRSVVIAEALRLTKKFGTPSAISFVNAIIDTFAKEIT